MITKDVMQLIVESHHHNRYKCECKGCYYYWTTSVAYDDTSGCFVDLISPKLMSTYFYLHGLLMTLNAKVAKGIKETFHSVFVSDTPVMRYI